MIPPNKLLVKIIKDCGYSVSEMSQKIYGNTKTLACMVSRDRLNMNIVGKISEILGIDLTFLAKENRGKVINERTN